MGHSHESLLNKICIWVFLIFCLHAASFGQAKENQSDNYWKAGVLSGADWSVIKDGSRSGLSFSGMGFGIGASLTKRINRSWFEWNGFYSTANLGNNVLPQTTVHQSYYNVNLIGMRDLNADREADFQFRAGGSLNALYADRNYPDFLNNQGSFEFAASLSAAASAKYNLEGNLNGFAISDLLMLPLVSYTIVPGYAGENISSSQKYLSIIAYFFRVINSFKISKDFSRHHTISAVFNFDFYHFGNDNNIRQSNSAIGLEYQYRF